MPEYEEQVRRFYGMPTKALNQAVKRNKDRFPRDFVFQLTRNEAAVLSRSQIVTLNCRRSAEPIYHVPALRFH